MKVSYLIHSISTGETTSHLSLRGYLHAEHRFNCPFLRNQNYAIASFPRRCTNPPTKHLTQWQAVCVSWNYYKCQISVSQILFCHLFMWLHLQNQNRRCHNWWMKTLMCGSCDWWRTGDRRSRAPLKRHPMCSALKSHYPTLTVPSPHPLHHIALNASGRSNSQWPSRNTPFFHKGNHSSGPSLAHFISWAITLSVQALFMLSVVI